VTLTLEVRGPQAASLGGHSRRQFGREGGVIGRAPSNDWVLPHTKVSGRHARITFADGVFYIEDTSTNGVFVNASKDRLVRGRPHPLESGDRLFIDPYEIRVTVSTEARAPTPRPQGRGADPFGLADPGDPFGAADPFGAEPPADPFAPARSVPGGGVRPDLGVSEPAASGQELDPMKLLGAGPQPTPARRAPSAQDLEAAPPMAAHYRPPAVRTPAPAATPGASVIPEGYDPLADSGPASRAELLARSTPAPPDDETPAVTTPPVRTPPPLAARPVAAVTPLPSPVADFHEPIVEEPEPAAPPPAPAPKAPARVNAPARQRAAPVATPSPTPPPEPPAATAAAGDLAAVLAGAGVEDAEVTEELARDFGRILRVVVSGVMDVLRARQQIKDEFRMRLTQFKPADNNPLKFSANVEDALHNLLVKRNAAYLEPVEAFEDAFDDVRSHQLAMLAGMRVAFEAMLREFNPERLQDHFDRQLKKGSLVSVPAKLRYWELYRDWSEALLKDPEASFRRLFGEEFARAYEDQLSRLRDERQRRRQGQTGE
jgi:type VI secretion system FHA domain protein